MEKWEGKNEKEGRNIKSMTNEKELLTVTPILMGAPRVWLNMSARK
jgi:hypothetical protein